VILSNVAIGKFTIIKKNQWCDYEGIPAGCIVAIARRRVITSGMKSIRN